MKSHFEKTISSGNWKECAMESRTKCVDRFRKALGKSEVPFRWMITCDKAAAMLVTRSLGNANKEENDSREELAPAPAINNSCKSN